MAKPRRKIEARDYDKLIQDSERKLEKLVSETKEERVRLRELKKTKELYDIQVAEEKKQEELQKIVELIEESGKSLDEIKLMLSNPAKETEDK